MRTFWMSLAAVGGVLAVFLVLQENYDKAFVAAAAGAVCWFLSYRQQVRATLASEEEEVDEESDDEVRS
ncbi:MAG TPA: hypothetical protein VJ306_02580 [Pyrinomonadaceae bacterium]|nr:hypothetical protein [Pyrinomonadaceae bacterium]